MSHENTSFKWIVLALLFLNFFFCIVGLMSLAPLFSEIIREMPLSKTQMGIIMGIGTFASLAFALVGGGLGDAYGCRWVLGVTAAVVVVSGALRAVSQSALHIIVCMFFLGGGLAVMNALMPKALSMWFPSRELARANGICFSALGLGTAVAMGTSASLVSPAVGGWRNAMVVFAAASLAAGILWVLFYRDGTKSIGAGAEHAHMMTNFKRVFEIKEIWLIALFYGLIMVSLMAIITLLPITLEEHGVQRAGEFVSILLTASFIFNILGGIMSDRAGRRKPFLIVCALIFGSCIPGFLIFKGASLAAVLAVAGASLGTTAPILMTLPVEVKQVGTALAGSAVGLILMFGNLGGFVGPVVTGALIDATGSAWPGFLFLAVTLFLAALFITPLQEPERTPLPDRP